MTIARDPWWPRLRRVGSDKQGHPRVSDWFCAVTRWAIYIDVEGSSTMYASDEAQFFAAVDALMDGICRIGSLVCPETPNRLFVHQTGGDGFIIVSEFAQRSPELPIAIGVVLMQTILATGGVAKAGISQGAFADVSGCFATLTRYPEDQGGRRRLGRGLMTVFPVMGTALINAHRLAIRTPRGARLAVDSSMMTQIPDGVVVSQTEKDLIVVDWVHTRTSLIDEIIAKTNLRLPSTAELQERLVAYVAKTAATTDEDWRHYTLCLNGCRSK